MSKNNMKVVHQNEELKKPDLETPEASSLYEILKELPKPETSMKLNAAQKKWWYWFGLEFISTNQIAKADLMHLQDAAFAMDMKCKLIHLINTANTKSDSGVGGIVQKFTSGATNITGYQSALKDQIKILDSISEYFGLSIKDRNKIKAVDGPGDNQLNLFDEMMKKLHG
jgi:hypothetical protein